MSLRALAGSPRARVALAIVLGAFVLALLAYGSWRGFPVQDDTYMLRLLRLGGPERVAAEHPDRPVFGALLSACTRVAGEWKLPYVAIGLFVWMLFAALVGRLWVRLFPEWSSAWPAVALALIAPVVLHVQFSTVTTVIPCVLPCVLVLAALLLALRADTRPSSALAIPVFLLSAGAALVSEYGIAAAAGAAALLIVLGSWRLSVPFVAGAGAGYAVFHATAKLTLRLETNPARQIEGILSRPWTRPFRVLSAAWGCIVGAWGRAAADFHVDWSSKTTIVAAALALGAATMVALLWRPSQAAAGPGAFRRAAALVVATLAALFPAISIAGWPLRLVFETRYLAPAMAFASCATVALLLLAVRARWATAALFAVAFLAADRLVLQAIEEGRNQGALERIGQAMRAVVADQTGVVVLVMRDRTGQSKEEVTAKATYRWPYPEAGRLWVLRPEDALEQFGPRAGCRRPATLTLRRESIRWPRIDEPIRLVFWDQGDWEDLDPEPYFRGCAIP